MAANSENQINLKTLQRVDSSIVEIIDNASQVAIYKYETQMEKWEGTDMEGALFLFRRSKYPYHGFIIVNRMNTTNFVESITGDMQFQLQEPYLLYKNHSGEIIGSWFYEYNDLNRITKKIQMIVLKQTSVPGRQRSASESETPKVDVATLLSRAHEKYKENISRGNCKKVLSDVSCTDPVSQDPVSPRRRFLSAGSVDSKVRAQPTGKCEGKEREPLSHLSPLFSCNEISSPISDIDALDTSFGQYHSVSNAKPSPLKPKELQGDWNTNVNSERDVHWSSMKHILKAHIEENRGLVLQLHEAYVSSLRSVFTRN